MKMIKVLLLMTTIAVFPTAPVAAGDIRFDAIETKHWQVINDTVMGGVSRSRFYQQGDDAIFEGTVSLDNNGGFASVRRVISPEFQNGSIIKLIVKGDGRRYQFRLKTHRLYEGAAYVAEFSTERNAWQQVTLYEKDFTARFRGRTISNAPTLKFGDAVQVGLLIGDKIEGDFRLQIQAIEVLETI